MSLFSAFLSLLSVAAKPDLYLWLVLRGSFLPLLHWQEAFNGNGIKFWSLGLNPVPPKSRGFFLTLAQQQWVLHVPYVDRVFCSPHWLRPFLLLLREGPRQGEARFHDFPMPPSFACLQTQGGATKVQHPHTSQVFLMNTGWSFGEELVCACTVPQYLRLPGVLYCHVSFSLTFSNSLILVDFLLSAYMVVNTSPMSCYMWTSLRPVSPWRGLSILEIQASWLPCHIGHLTDPIKCMILSSIQFSVWVRVILYQERYITGISGTSESPFT